MKYHYFHGRFTYSVKRSGPPLAGRLNVASAAAGFYSRIEARAGRARPGVHASGARAAPNTVARSELGTLPDGEFDWGGTSVKR
jgi:hypothetical protein